MGKNKKKALILLQELLTYPLPTEGRGDEIVEELKEVIPDPNFIMYIYYSDDFITEDGSFDYEGLLIKCFDDYEPNVIAL
ncbi:hypothetical protein [Pseudodesulfovibrio pelocollis]|uniref:hypothetical protein n=1 Tax=Pseudodesulfovibrio pelocollis TaxID=3051432 RepID=UPI00255AEDC7|nr:hypothetical protein [Pseudodesulfovibrio sp. SB368]